MRSNSNTDRIEGTKMEVGNPVAEHPLLHSAPQCRRCGVTTHKSTVLPWNENGNGDRPMFKCGKCKRFSCFGDMRGIHADHPKCKCKEPQASRMIVAGRKDTQVIPRALYLQCAVGGCDFFGYVVHEGEPVVLWDRALSTKEMIEIGL
jgi:hypothetical protein